MSTHILFLLCICCVVKQAFQSTTCTQVSSCSCKFENGTVLDLSPLAQLTRPRFVVKGFQYDFLYNPCYDFTFGQCENVAVCQFQSYEGNYYILGTQDSAYFIADTDENIVFLTYSHTDQFNFTRYTTVQLGCDNQSTTDDFMFLGESRPRVYVFRLISPHCCAK